MENGEASAREDGELTMVERSKAEEFLKAYRAAFEAFDVGAIADLFSYPCQITSDAGEIDVTLAPTREAWLRQIERLVAAYRAIGVRSAEVLDLRVAELTPRLAQAAVRWRLIGEAGEPLYEFDAAYTLADFGQGLRVTAISHNETPRLRAAVERGGPD